METWKAFVEMPKARRSKLWYDIKCCELFNNVDNGKQQQTPGGGESSTSTTKKKRRRERKKEKKGRQGSEYVERSKRGRM